MPMGKKKLTQRQRNDLIRLREMGLSYDRIAKIYDLNVKSVYEIIQKAAVDKSTNQPLDKVVG